MSEEALRHRLWFTDARTTNQVNLLAALRDACEMRGGVAVVGGPDVPRLVESAATAASKRGMHTVRRRVSTADSYRPFSVFHDILPRLAEDGFSPLFGRSVSAQSGLSFLPSSSMELFSTVDAILDAIGEAAVASPVALIVEDWELCDRASKMVMEKLSVFGRQHRVLVIAA